MRIAKLRIRDFRRFTDLTIEGIPESARLVLLVGGNGTGKSSVFDALQLKYQIQTGFGWNSDIEYYSKGRRSGDAAGGVEVEFHGEERHFKRGAVYIRSAYRNEVEFVIQSLNRMEPLVDERRIGRMIDGDATVSRNYQRLVSDAIELMYGGANDAQTVGQVRDSLFNQIKSSTLSLFPDLELRGLGKPLENGTFTFKKGAIERFEYKNLSGGEKAAFDLLLDVITKRTSFADAVYGIDEPEAHMNARLQAQLLHELLKILPEPCQLWIATHSVGMMRAALDIYRDTPGSVAFLNFDDRDFDHSLAIRPMPPSRPFWENALRVTVGDLADLVAPREVILCEGNPAAAVPGKSGSYDAVIYNRIFEGEFPEAKFVSGGNSHDVASDRLALTSTLTIIAPGIEMKRLIDRDDHSAEQVAELNARGIRVLKRRNIESFLYDDEVLSALCIAEGKSEAIPEILADKVRLMAEVTDRAPDDLKPLAGRLYLAIKSRLSLVGRGNDHRSFARDTLAPVITPNLRVYAELKHQVFGPQD